VAGKNADRKVRDEEKKNNPREEKDPVKVRPCEISSQRNLMQETEKWGGGEKKWTCRGKDFKEGGRNVEGPSNIANMGKGERKKRKHRYWDTKDQIDYCR